MSNWRNVTELPLTVDLNVGSGKPPKVVEPGKILTVSDDMDYIVGTLIGVDQVEKVELDEKKPAAAK